MWLFLFWLNKKPDRFICDVPVSVKCFNKIRVQIMHKQWENLNQSITFVFQFWHVFTIYNCELKKNKTKQKLNWNAISKEANKIQKCEWMNHKNALPAIYSRNYFRESVDEYNNYRGISTETVQSGLWMPYSCSEFMHLWFSVHKTTAS